MTELNKVRPAGRTLCLGLFLAFSAAAVAWGLDPRPAITQYGRGVWTTANGLPQDSIRGISSDTALRLARYFSTTPAFWMNLQSTYSLEVAEREAKGQIDRDVHPLNAAA